MMQNSQKPVWLRWGIVVLLIALAIAFGIWLRDLLVSDKPKKAPIQQITLLRPPPPPKPPEQKPPEPEVKKEEVKLREPEPAPQPDQPRQADAPPPNAIPDGPPGGPSVDLPAGPPTLPDSARKGNPWAWYDAILNDAVNSAFQNALSREKTLKDKNYKVVVQVWIDAQGDVSRAALVDTTGDPKVDELLKETLRNMRALREGPPPDMPQPVKIRVTSRA